jgi:hypothetical protein
MTSLLSATLALLLVPSVPALQDGAHELRVIDAGTWHLGDDATPEWPEAAEQPDGQRLEFVFAGRALDGPATLTLRQRHVNDAWHVEVNGRRIARLEALPERVQRYYEIPAGVLVDGDNTFALVPDVPTDDITVGEIGYYEASLRQVLDLRPCVVTVTDETTGAPLPARVTVVDAAGELVRLHYGEALHTAVRDGVIYTSEGAARFEVPAGAYRVYAARGTEWSLAEGALDAAGEAPTVALTLRRELDTTGFVAADTHIHTLTHSGHGDSSVEERLVTLAGEGVELAIATDHNHNTDYRPLQVEMGLLEHFTPVVGNEVTTPVGHLNAFPLDPADEVPLHTGNDLVAIVDDARAKGALAVILNHPRWPAHDTGPHGKHELDQHTGEWTGDWACVYDAMELINSQTAEPTPMVLFRDWFALLNRGEDVRAVASSDSHTVGGVVGQGRTYVLSSTDDPARIDVEECARNIARGRSSISMGIFVDVRLGGRSILGELLPQRGPANGAGPVDGIELRVAAPSWVRPERVTLFANGLPLHELALEAVPGQPTDVTLAVPAALPWPLHDFWLVAVVTGAGVGGPWWPQLNDYTLAATNPVQLDVDGDGRFASPRALATALVERRGTGAEAVTAMLAEVDSATAVQVLHLVRSAYLRRAHQDLERLGQAALDRHPTLRGWLEALPAPR